MITRARACSTHSDAVLEEIHRQYGPHILDGIGNGDNAFRLSWMLFLLSAI
jgi:hypothetical protein